MTEFKIKVFIKNTGEVIDEFVTDFEDTDELIENMENEIIHDYDIPYNELFYVFEEY